MSSSSNYDSNVTPFLPGRNVVYNNIRSPTAQISNLTVDLINGVPPPTAPPITKPVGSILSVTAPGVASFDEDVDLIGDVKIAGNSGLVNQYIKKTGASTQDWSYVAANDISPGLVGEVMITGGGSIGDWAYLNASNFDSQTPNTVLSSNGSGVVSFSKVPAVNISPGANNQVLTVFSGNADWNLLTEANFAPNLANSALNAGPGGVVSFSKLPVRSISPGSSYQIIQTKSDGSEPEWSSRFNGDSLKFSYAPLNQSIMNIYYESGLINADSFSLKKSTLDVSIGPLLTNMEYTVVGNLVTLVVREFILTELDISIGQEYYGFIKLDTALYPWIQPKTIVSPSNYKQTSGYFSYVDGSTLTNLGQGMFNVYSDYYNKGYPAIEFIKSDAIAYVAGANHGTGFLKVSGSQTTLMVLSSPLVIQYIRI